MGTLDRREFVQKLAALIGPPLLPGLLESVDPERLAYLGPQRCAVARWPHRPDEELSQLHNAVLPAMVRKAITNHLRRADQPLSTPTSHSVAILLSVDSQAARAAIPAVFAILSGTDREDRGRRTHRADREHGLLDAIQRRESSERIDQRAAMTLIHCRGAGVRPTLRLALRTNQP